MTSYANEKLFPVLGIFHGDNMPICILDRNAYNDDSIPLYLKVNSQLWLCISIPQGSSKCYATGMASKKDVLGLLS